jgi:hypothetical protein
MALSSLPFCPYGGRQADLLYLPARWRYRTQYLGITYEAQGTIGGRSTALGRPRKTMNECEVLLMRINIPPEGAFTPLLGLRSF